jgi:hypothetical protein
VAKAQHARDVVGVGVDPGHRHAHQLRSMLGVEKRVEPTEPSLDNVTAEPKVSTHSHETRNFSGVRANPVDGHEKDSGEILVGKEERRSQFRRLCDAYKKRVHLGWHLLQKMNSMKYHENQILSQLHTGQINHL